MNKAIRKYNICFRNLSIVDHNRIVANFNGYALSTQRFCRIKICDISGHDLVWKQMIGEDGFQFRLVFRLE